MRGSLKGMIAAAGCFAFAAAAQAQEIKFWTLSFDNPNVAKAFQEELALYKAELARHQAA